MLLDVAYRGRSEVRPTAAGMALALAPNLRRDRVGFAGTLRHPLRFREAVSALHDVVVSDLRYKPRDKSAYREWQKQQRQREAALHARAAGAAREQLLAVAPQPVPPELEAQFRRHRTRYWKARDEYSRHLQREDPELWRMLVPCDPVITVAPDVLFFECFSADESSYGCLSVDRDGFTAEGDVSLGTTNVDYSWRLYDHFQEIRSYRQTRFAIDPAGFEVQTGPGAPAYREEKIPLPPSWLRGFMALQSAMSLPMRRVPVSREGLYSVLAFLGRRRARTSPRAVRFELTPGKPVAIVLEPWEQRVELHGTPYPGSRAEVVRVWGRDRLRVLARLLPVLDGADVYLLGTGLPSFWVARLGDMRLTLGLSGWTANDWTSGGSAVEQLLPPAEPDADLVGRVAGAFRENPVQTLAGLSAREGGRTAEVVATLNRLAHLGQVIHDLAAGVYRWRQVMPVTLSAEQLGPENAEVAAARELVRYRRVGVEADTTIAAGRAVRGRFGSNEIELVMDADGRLVAGKCNCSHFYRGGLRRGPCRHLQALRTVALAGAEDRPTLAAWLARLVQG